MSDSKYQVSRLKTRTRTQNRSQSSNLVRIGLGLRIEFLTFPVSDLKSGLENLDSGNSGIHIKKISAPFFVKGALYLYETHPPCDKKKSGDILLLTGLTTLVFPLFVD